MNFLIWLVWLGSESVCEVDLKSNIFVVEKIYIECYLNKN